MSFLTPEKVTHSIQALLLFLNISRETSSLNDQEVEVLRTKCLELMERLSTGKVEVVKGTLALNELIEEMNLTLTVQNKRDPNPEYHDDHYDRSIEK